MKKFSIEFYEKDNGDIPVENFLNSMDTKMRVKTVGLLQILQEKGNFLREPYSKYLEDGIFELRIKAGTNISRLLYFFYYEGKIVVTNGFIKKTNKTPRSEIERAKRFKKEYLERVNNNENT